MNARLRMLLVGMVGVAGSVAVWAQAAQTSGRDADAAAIRAHIESIFAAFIDKDAAKLAATHGRDWRGYLTYSRTVVKGRDGYMKANVGSEGMEPKGQGMVGYKIQEYDTVFYGDVGVVNFVADVHHDAGHASADVEADAHGHLRQGRRQLDPGRVADVAPSRLSGCSNEHVRATHGRTEEADPGGARSGVACVLQRGYQGAVGAAAARADHDAFRRATVSAPTIRSCPAPSASPKAAAS